MLAADKDRLVAALKQDALILRQKELEYYVERYTNITTQASIVAGFSFDALVELDITQELHDELVEDGNEWIEVLYYTAASCAMAFALFTVVVSSFATVYGHRLALQGPSGSVERSVAVLMKQRNQIFLAYGISLVCLVVSAISMAWIKMGDAAAGATGVFLLLLVALLYKHTELKRMFAIPKGSMVGGDVRLGGGMDVSRLNEHSVAQRQMPLTHQSSWVAGDHQTPHQKNRWFWNHGKRGISGKMPRSPGGSISTPMVEVGPNAMISEGDEECGGLRGSQGM